MQLPGGPHNFLKGVDDRGDPFSGLLRVTITFKRRIRIRHGYYYPGTFDQDKAAPVTSELVGRMCKGISMVSGIVLAMLILWQLRQFCPAHFCPVGVIARILERVLDASPQFPN